MAPAFELERPGSRGSRIASRICSKSARKKMSTQASRGQLLLQTKMMGRCAEFSPPFNSSQGVSAHARRSMAPGLSPCTECTIR